ncbi:ABC-type branched-subunit amino acid transport system substrate-binding protein [Acidovorax soli]|uniref:ABC-type branched-subunit amino acid transport system substrate-binding protein n=1 Tax=Acidovorax soli TaxID=592050 RepID=A0A7X0P9D4_9BURK|nr:ABC transporter substrate-binding protein [Acidovorax soli]MBB6557437.1 ABC-type branched-subunit amino acid transport system substrate-binding protein [Acidovorax soli]
MEFEDTAPLAPEAPESESRRRFVAGAGAVAVAAALGAPSLAGAAPSSPLGAGRSTLRVGMLLPQGRAYPLLGAQLMAGAQAFAQQQTAGPRLHFTPVAYGSHSSQAQRAAQELLATGQVDVLAGFVDAGAQAAPWEPLLERYQVPLLVGDTGANALSPQARSPWVVHNSLAYWQAAWATGRWAAKALGPRAIVAVGPADSGFDHLPAFERGLASAGGRVQNTVFTRAADGASQLEELALLVRQTRPDFVFALDSGARADAFQQFWAGSDAARHVPLVAGGMLGETMAAAALQQPAQGPLIWATRPWQPRLSDTALASALGTRSPTPFHVLGHEMAQRLHAAALSRPRGLQLAQAMEAAVLQTPRGEVRLDTASGETVVSAYLHGLHLGQTGSAVALPSVHAGSCQGLCEILGSRIAGTYLAT